MFKPLPHCSCENCNQLCFQRYMEKFAKDNVYKFLNGLNESYAALRSQILLMKPFPRLDEAYNLIMREKSQRNIRMQTQPLLESFAMASVGGIKKKMKSNIIVTIVGNQNIKSQKKTGLTKLKAGLYTLQVNDVVFQSDKNVSAIFPCSLHNFGHTFDSCIYDTLFDIPYFSNVNNPCSNSIHITSSPHCSDHDDSSFYPRFDPSNVALNIDQSLENLSSNQNTVHTTFDELIIDKHTNEHHIPQSHTFEPDHSSQPKPLLRISTRHK
ncbi:Uncharacterized protein TCM_017141 [Theobroma cacao]|uniref:Uncharacterized protein n=1 Tax=Theobroma cacao TaxID=3641 RepID=A0A061EDR3_THECC|nr:Uncharacterized protein TCM_017141 [Theobroma cacao]